MIIGIIGLSLLALGWFTEAAKMIKEKRSSIDIKFGILYVIGSLLLVIYSYQINDNVFLILNGLVVLSSGLSLFYAVKYKK
jgi:lipid-A-disaccharide synthase-like uncharacterized protein